MTRHYYAREKNRAQNPRQAYVYYQFSTRAARDKFVATGTICGWPTCAVPATNSYIRSGHYYIYA